MRILNWRLNALLVIYFILLISILSGLDNTLYKEELLYAKPIVVSHTRVKGDLSIYMHQMALRESNNTLGVVNRIGMLGKYQFSPKTLWGLGIRFKVDKNTFLSDERLQDDAMIAYLKRNRNFLSFLIFKYDGRVYNGMYITESGLLAGAHLVGPHGLRAYFDPIYTVTVRDRIFRPRIQDSNGTKVSEYIEMFSGYDLTELES